MCDNTYLKLSEGKKTWAAPGSPGLTLTALQETQSSDPPPKPEPVLSSQKCWGWKEKVCYNVMEKHLVIQRR